VFVGPSPAAIEVMGDKIRAKATVSAAGVPVVPGAGSAGTTDAELVRAANALGGPVLVKPSAGGGGKGMRVVTDLAELPEALVSARREALASFGDDTLLIERYVATPRHIEVQVMADSHGTTLHLGERECSLQRRHQKVIEEAPSPFLSSAQREAYGALAVSVARAVDYAGAGTVELIVDADRPDEPWFMEMNTRLQVEHPVTEAVTGLDLVELQLRVAAGERLPLTQADVHLDGHAVEARVYAEDPAAGFLPTGGTALVVREPAGLGVRVDSALVEGEPVGTSYDPMLAKVVAWGPDRDTALDRLDRALADSVLLGCTTNTGFLRRLVALPDVRAGRLDTGLLERTLGETTAGEPTPHHLAAFVLHQLVDTGDDPWESLPGWRPVTPVPVVWDLGADRLRVAVLGSTMTVGEQAYEIGGTPDLVTVDGRTQPAVVARSGDDTWVATGGEVHVLPLSPPAHTRARGVVEGAEVHSPMPGTVIAVEVRDGDVVTANEALLVVEAMKMEHVLRAPAAGTATLVVREGDQVTVGQLLATVEPADDATEETA
jgi:acetyl-CoA/propionyl-CoA carboxylase, biotin carboxylase, biotin carboxyl carrier protein